MHRADMAVTCQMQSAMQAGKTHCSEKLEEPLLIREWEPIAQTSVVFQKPNSFMTSAQFTIKKETQFNALSSKTASQLFRYRFAD